MKEVTAEKYNDIVEQVSNKYSKLKNIDSEMLQSEVIRLKKEWKNMTQGNKKSTKSARKSK